MNIRILRVSTPSDIVSVAALAQKIWRQHFPAIIGLPQVKYMLEKFQSAEAITTQIKNGTEYYLAVLDGQHAGYTALLPDPESRKMMISKIYILESNRGKGIGGQLLHFIENDCRNRNIDTLWLTVNRFNHDPIAWYKHKGFETVDEVKKDIGGGFFMDDYIMEKKI